jgi:hypothetical protein
MMNIPLLSLGFETLLTRASNVVLRLRSVHRMVSSLLGRFWIGTGGAIEVTGSSSNDGLAFGISYTYSK